MTNSADQSRSAEPRTLRDDLRFLIGGLAGNPIILPVETVQGLFRKLDAILDRHSEAAAQALSAQRPDEVLREALERLTVEADAYLNGKTKGLTLAIYIAQARRALAANERQTDDR